MWADSTFKYLPVYIAVAVAVHQRWRVNRYAQDPWKGGGFGMFSDIFGTASLTATLVTRGPHNERIEYRLDAPAPSTSKAVIIPTRRHIVALGRMILLSCWRAEKDRAVLCHDGDGARPLQVEAVILRCWKTEFCIGTGTHSGTLANTVTVNAAGEE
jgi:hypothetical protein